MQCLTLQTGSSCTDPLARLGTQTLTSAGGPMTISDSVFNEPDIYYLCLTNTSADDNWVQQDSDLTWLYVLSMV